MTDALGLSIGMTNLVAAREGREPVIRRSILTLYSDRAPEVGEYTGNGLPLAGFVERVGDPVPLVAADGSQHRGELVLAEALDVMARLAGGGAPIAIAVPAHWGPGTIGALRAALRNKPALTPDGVPPALVPDSLTALATLQAQPGLPADGVVVLCDLGGSGTSVTLADAGAGFTPIGTTVRYPDFSGDQIDQALLNHVLSGVATANDTDPAGTAAVGSLTRLRAECRQAKERLSAETATAIPTELPGFHADVRVTRPELDQLVSAPLAGLLDAIEDTLQRNNIAVSSVTAVATVGGGAAIPLVTQRLSERLRAPVVTTPQPALVVATGAALVADRVAEAGAPTGMAPEVAAADAPTGMAPTGMAPTGMAPTTAAPAANGGDSAAFGALAWSQDDAPGSEPVPYEGGDYDATAGTAAARPAVEFSHDEEMYDAAPTPLPWYKRPPILFGAAAAAALLAAGGLAVTLTSSEGDSSPVTETSTTYSMGPSPEGPPPEPVTTVTQGPDGIETTTVIAPPPPPPETTTSEPTSESETTTTTTSPTTTTTTTTQPTTTTTTTRTTTTQPPTTTTQPPTTTNPPTTTAAPPTTTAADSGDGGGA
ncbi:Hsp70 family protein [Mycobacterium sp. TNTM28]|uniref:Hsp70 family protein n=1 Tax=[Mycobacterium] fortunisiensis TaxID=2600579 RepID=A0ABS6KGK6_9MYCO|nr:Hsp70 family protein [[Mycobacterium] fortunisiensis]MBU9762699.1 Hsp70 family protein [[Mycobacterium] fortunisiensis]